MVVVGDDDGGDVAAGAGDDELADGGRGSLVGSRPLSRAAVIDASRHRYGIQVGTGDITPGPGGVPVCPPLALHDVAIDGPAMVAQCISSLHTRPGGPHHIKIIQVVLSQNQHLRAAQLGGHLALGPHPAHRAGLEADLTEPPASRFWSPIPRDPGRTWLTPGGAWMSAAIA